MSLLPEENNTPNIEEEESTIFGASPTRELRPKAKKGGKMLRNIIVSVLVLVLLAGSAFAIVRLIPEREDGIDTSFDDTIEVISIDETKVKSVKIVRTDSTSVYNTTLAEKKSDDDDDSTTVKATWSIEGIDPSLTQSSSISTAMASVLTLDAARGIDKEKGADYGFANPTYTVTVTGYDSADNVTLLVGSATPTASGYYATIDGGETVLLLESSDVDALATPDTSMAVPELVTAAVKSDGNSDYFESDVLSKVDYISLSGKNYKQGIRFEMNGNEGLSAYMTYIMTAPSRRYTDTDKVTALFEVASVGLSGADAYCYAPTAADFSRYGLSLPDILLEIKYGKQKTVLKATLQEDGSYAAYSENGKNIIYKIETEALAFAAYTMEDYASGTAFAEMLTELREMTFKTAENSYVFGVTYVEADEEDEDAEDVLTVTYGGKELTTENFQNFYQYLVGMELNEIATEKTAGTPTLTLKAVRSDGTYTELRFIKYSDRRYYVEADGNPLGYLSSAYMDKVLGYLADAAADKTVPDPY